MVGLDFTDKQQRDAARLLVANMPDDGLLALLQWSSSEDFERLFALIAGIEASDVVS